MSKTKKNMDIALRALADYVYDNVQDWPHRMPVAFSSYNPASHDRCVVHRGTMPDLIALHAVCLGTLIKEHTESEEEAEELLDVFTKTVKERLIRPGIDDEDDEDEEEEKNGSGITVVDLSKGLPNNIKKDLLQALKKVIEDVDEE